MTRGLRTPILIGLFVSFGLASTETNPRRKAREAERATAMTDPVTSARRLSVIRESRRENPALRPAVAIAPLIAEAWRSEFLAEYSAQARAQGSKKNRSRV